MLAFQKLEFYNNASVTKIQKTMVLFPKIKFLSLFALAVLFAGLLQAPTAIAATDTNPRGHTTAGETDAQQIIGLCARKLDIPENNINNQQIQGCESGYNLGLNGKNASACDDLYADSDQAAEKACKETGYNLGRTNPLNLKTAQKQDQNDQGPDNTQGDHCDGDHCDLVRLYINPAIRLLTVLVGLVVAASLVFAGIQYIASSGDPQRIGAAKRRITGSLTALLAFAFLYAFLNFIVPGGIF